MSSRRRKAGIVFCIVFALLLLIVVIAFFAVRSIFTDTSVRRTPVAEINPQDYRMAQLKTASAVSRIRNASEHTPPQELVLTRDEFNALTETLLNLSGQISRDMKIGGVRLQDTALKLNDDSFRLFYSYDTGMKTPFGSRVNFRIDLDFRIEDGRSFLQFRNTRMGNMAMPGALRDKLEENWRSFQRSQAHRELLDSVESLSIGNGELRVRYRPYRAKQNFAPSALSAVDTVLNPLGSFR